eukprot:7298668-Alexandrium_andersonii.AAC.1
MSLHSWAPLGPAQGLPHVSMSPRHQPWRAGVARGWYGLGREWFGGGLWGGAEGCTLRGYGCERGA